MRGMRELLILLCAVTAVAPTAVEAQRSFQVDRTRTQTGWLGIRADLTVAGRTEGSGVTVVRVFDDGPAARVGLRAGDRVIQVNGRPASPELFARTALQLEPGDRLSLTIDRDDGFRKRVVITAAEPPDAISVFLPAELTDRVRSTLRELDSMAVDFVFSTDSLGSGVNALAGRAVLGDSGRVTVLGRRDGPRGARYDVEIDRGTADEAGSSGNVGPWRLLSREPDTLRSVAPETPERGYRPLLLYSTGERIVAGARLTELNPDLAGYFGVEGGLLVTDVIDGTPAAEMELRPGDVIVEISGRTVRTRADARLAWTPKEGDLTLTIVRKGERQVILIPDGLDSPRLR